MKITDVKVTVYEEPVKHPFRWREGLPGSGTSNVNAWVEIETDEGITGKAGVSHGRIAEDIVNHVAFPVWTYCTKSALSLTDEKEKI